MVINQFFKNKGPFPLTKILNNIGSNCFIQEDLSIHDIQDLLNAGKHDITFLHNDKYKKDSLNTKAIACVTSKNLSQYLPSKCIKIITKNVLLDVTKISKLF